MRSLLPICLIAMIAMEGQAAAHTKPAKQTSFQWPLEFEMNFALEADIPIRHHGHMKEAFSFGPTVTYLMTESLHLSFGTTVEFSPRWGNMSLSTIAEAEYVFPGHLLGVNLIGLTRVESADPFHLRNVEFLAGGGLGATIFLPNGLGLQGAVCLMTDSRLEQVNLLPYINVSVPIPVTLPTP